MGLVPREIDRLRPEMRERLGFPASSWPSPMAQQANGEPEAFLERKRRAVARGSSMGISLTDLNMVAKLTGWPTPTTQDAASSGASDYPPSQTHHAGTTLTDATRLAPWPTTTTHDAGRGGQAKRAMGETRHGSNLQDFALLAPWATPVVPNGGRKPKGGRKPTTGQTPDGKKRQVDNNFLANQVIAAWATPMSCDQRGSAGVGKQELPNQASGVMSSGSPAATARPGQLNPRFSLWLQGFPTAWASCGERVTRSSLKSRKSSSKRISLDSNKFTC